MNIEDDNGVTAIGYIDIAPIRDLSVEYAYADEKDKVNGNQPVECCIKNNGDSEIKSFNIVISDESGNEYVNKDIICSIESGAEQEFTENLNIENLNNETKFTMMVSAEGENAVEDNSAEFLLGCPDVSLSVSQYKINNKLLIASRAANGSNTPVNAAISIAENLLDGVTLDMQNIGLLDNKTEYIYNYEINLDDVNFNEDGVKYYYVKVDTLENDFNPYDNYYVIPVYKVELFDISNEKPEEINIVNAEGVEVEPKNMSVNLLDTNKRYITAKVLPDNATNKEVKWYSDNTDIVRITGEGEIVAVGEGTAVVRAETYDGGYTDEANITVYSEEQGLYLLTVETPLNGKIIAEGGQYTEGTKISVSAQPNAGYKFKSWISSNGGTFDNANSPSTTFTMPANDTAITADFEKEISLPSGGGGGIRAKSYSITIKYIDENNEEVGASKLSKAFGYTLKEGDLSIPKGYVINEINFNYQIKKSETITVQVKKESSDKIEPSDDPGDGITKQTEDKYISGYSDGSFGPDRKITRAEISAIIYNMLNKNPDDYSSYIRKFSDISLSHWAADMMGYMIKNSYMSGDADADTFRPDDNMTRAELAQLLYNLNITGTEKASASFIDISKHWGEKAIKAMSAAGVISGYGDNTFRPNNNVTRAEAVSMISRLFNRSNKWTGDITFTDVSSNHWAYSSIMNAANGYYNE